MYLKSLGDIKCMIIYLIEFCEFQNYDLCKQKN